jgi:hypothetical protein
MSMTSHKCRDCGADREAGELCGSCECQLSLALEVRVGGNGFALRVVQ